MKHTETESLIHNLWGELEHAVCQPRHPFRWPVLATASSSGDAHLRIVVLRAVHSNHLTVYTDARTQKVADLKQNPKASLLFFDPAKLLQLRIIGDTIIHSQDPESKRLWENLKPRQKIEYQSVFPPGSIAEREITKTNVNIESKYFSVLKVYPKEMDLLQLSPTGHSRHRLKRNGDAWSLYRVVP
jgi:pyridoxine/pyridoxamine 5'-phosphate oxidase